MADERGFLVQGVSAEGGVMAVGGLYRGGRNPRPLFAKALRSFTVQGSVDAFFVDYRLAALVREVASANVIAAGASIRLPRLADGGGVIGGPHRPAGVAAGLVEEIASGLFCIALPGRYGVAAVLDAERAGAVATILQAGTLLNGKRAVERLCADLADLSAAFVLTADGSVPGQTGCVAVWCSGRLESVVFEKHVPL
ncbi:hypothetical protein LJC26_06950 [Desulfovibrio sp. OttesenSCG-928-O18]|nr:hypothetical protein [Desulfovibrio sp. OttesenSCG-928-O18]